MSFIKEQEAITMGTIAGILAMTVYGFTNYDLFVRLEKKAFYPRSYLGADVGGI